MLCLEDHKTYTSPVKKLESEDGLGVGDTDSTRETCGLVLWRST